MNKQDIEHMTKCESCLRSNRKAFNIIESLLKTLDLEKEQASLWKQLLKDELNRSWWSRLLS